MRSAELRNYLPELHVVQVALPGQERAPLLFEAPIRMASATCIEVFLPVPITSEPTLDQAASLLLSWERGEMLVSITGRVEKRPAPDRLLLEILDINMKPSRRRYPRVDANIDLKFWPTGGNGQPARWARSPEVNVSCCGLRFHSDGWHQKGQHLGIELSFPETSWPPVYCLGKVVRCENHPEGGCWVGLDIISISRTNLDVLVQFYLAEQVRHLQARVRNLGSILRPVVASRAGDPNT